MTCALHTQTNARFKILEKKAEIAEICDETDPILTRLGGGFRDVEVRVLETAGGPMVITHLIIDTRDAMGACSSLARANPLSL